MFIRKVVPENLDKQRIDYILKELELVESRNQALALIISGKVFVDNENINISTKGRHDPCVGIRALPVGEAMIALVLADCFLINKIRKKSTS